MSGRGRWDTGFWDWDMWDTAYNTLFDEVIEQLEQQNVSTNLWYSVYMYKHGFVWYDNEFCILFDEVLEQLEK